MRVLFTILMLAAWLMAANASARVATIDTVIAGASAAGDTTGDEIYQEKVTLEEAVRRVRKQYGGRIVSAETRGRPGNRVHVIKVLTDSGRVHTVRVAAE